MPHKMKPGRRTAQDAQVQAFLYGRRASLCHGLHDTKPLDENNLLYLEELHSQAMQWATSIRSEITRIRTARRLQEGVSS